ncbi:MAG: ribonuclease Z [Candidatus Aenigmarchaeota archaeon]|nr:ribonuclease Z [Candidatus Aenigmarchaeota archaeon]
MLEVIFLGTGSGPPTRDRNHSAILFRYAGHNLLFDCGEGTQRQMIMAKGVSFMKINHVFITHWHADHWIGLIGMLYTMNLEGRKHPLYIHGPDAERFISNILDMDYWGTSFGVVPKSVPFEGNIERKIYETDEFVITSIPTKHSVPSVAYCFRERDKVNVDISKAKKLYGLGEGKLVGVLKKKGEIVFKGKKIRLKDVAVIKKGVKVVYSGDTEPCENIIKISKNADVLIHDATFIEEREDRMHSSVKQAAKIAKNADVRCLILTHFSRRYTDLKELEREARKVFKNSYVARDFMRLRIKNNSLKVDFVK